MPATRDRRVPRLLFLFTIVLALLGVAACGGSAQKPVVAPVATDSAWIPQFLGGPADFTTMVRPNALRFDTYWGPLVSRLMANEHGDAYSRMSVQQLASSRQIDVYVTLRDPLRLYGGGNSKGVDATAVGWIAIVYGMPPTDPVPVRTNHGGPVFTPPVRLPSGVLMFSGDANLANESAGLSPTLFFTPDGAWIATDQVSAPRVRDFLSRTPTAPPQLSSTADGLAGVTMNVTSMKFVDSAKNASSAMWSGATAAGLGLRGGANGALEGYADYATSDDADRAYKSFQAECAAKPNECMIQPGFFKEAKAEKDDKRLLVTLAFSDALLRSIQSYSSP